MWSADWGGENEKEREERKFPYGSNGEGCENL